MCLFDFVGDGLEYRFRKCGVMPASLCVLLRRAVRCVVRDPLERCRQGDDKELEPGHRRKPPPEPQQDRERGTSRTTGTRRSRHQSPTIPRRNRLHVRSYYHYHSSLQSEIQNSRIHCLQSNASNSIDNWQRTNTL